MFGGQIRYCMSSCRNDYLPLDHAVSGFSMQIAWCSSCSVSYIDTGPCTAVKAKHTCPCFTTCMLVYVTHGQLIRGEHEYRVLAKA